MDMVCVYGMLRIEVRMKSKRPTAKKLEAIWNLAVKTRAGFKCEYHRGACEGNLHSHHICGKRTLRQRTALENGIAVCGYVHQRVAHEDGGVGVRAYEFKEWAVAHRKVSIEHLNSLGEVLGSDNFAIMDELKDALQMYQQMGPEIIGAKPKRGRKKRGDNG